MYFFGSSHWLAITFQILYLVTSIAAVIVVIAGNRNPVKTLAWILLFFVLPFLGIVFYIFFGQDYTRQKLISRKKRRKVNVRLTYPEGRRSINTLPEEYRTMARLLNHRNQFPVFMHNEVEIFSNGDDKFARLLEDIRHARHYIHVQYYIIESDTIGNKVKELLVEKASQGVEVRVIVDDVGCWKVPKEFFGEMRKAGIRTAIFQEVHFHRLTSKINFRNHRKLVIIDGKLGYTGGMNIADRYHKGLAWGIWKDLHLRIEGQAVEALESAFLIDWYFTTRELLPLKHYFHDEKILQKGDTPVQVITSGPFGEWREILQAYLKIIHSAKEYVYLQTPYFLPGESLLTALQTAALSGVDVRLMIPERSDSHMVHLATRSYLKSILKAGVKVYLYQPGFLHSKMVVSDDAVSTVGSTNLDFRSFEHNFEINAFLYQKEMALKLKEVFLNDQNHCRRITLNHWIKRPRVEKFTESTIRLFSPLL
jgi:Phosphatidylserine/phosphatidylglycerophosphate/cardiolipin synthases and related enzymes